VDEASVRDGRALDAARLHLAEEREGAFRVRSARARVDCGVLLKRSNRGIAATYLSSSQRRLGLHTLEL
jgi:hypothetical protein